MNQERNEWVRHHCMLFALLSEQEVEVVYGWYDMLAPRWSLAEMKAASEWISLHAPPYRSEHLHALETCLAKKRSEAIAREKEEQKNRDWGECVTCRSCGLVSVPARRQDRETREWHMPQPLGRAEFYTMVVACCCALGRWKQGHWGSEKGIIDLAEYEAINPDWKNELAAHETYLRQRVVNADKAGVLDKALGAIRKRQQAAGVKA